MTPEKSLKKIISDVKRFNLDGIWIRDDNFFVDLKRVRYICEGILGHNLNIGWYTAGTRANDINRMDDELLRLIKKSGCETFKIGAESGSNRVLKYIKKVQTKEDILNANRKVIKFDIDPIYTFIIGFPAETKEDMIETIETMKQVQKENRHAMIDALNMFTPHKATALYNDALGMGLKEPKRLEEWQTWFFRGANNTPWFSKKEQTFITNACDASVYYENVRRFFDSINNSFIRVTLKILMYLPEKYFRFKWKHNLFGPDPAFSIMRFARNMFLKER